jgi:hypothetical protein
MASSAEKSPNFYYALKAGCALYYISTSDWNENNTDYTATYFGK